MSSGRVKGLGRFFKEVHGEFLKIIWPSRREFIGSVVIAVIMICIFAVYLGVVDYCLGRLMGVFNSLLGI